MVSRGKFRPDWCPGWVERKQQFRELRGKTMEILKVGFIGAGFNAGFHLRALTEHGGVRGAEVMGVCALKGAERFALTAKAAGMPDCQVYDSVADLCQAVDVVSFSFPNKFRVEILREVFAAVKAGAKLKGIVCEKPFARNMAEANEMLRLLDELARLGVFFAYFENQIFMPTVRACREQLETVAAKTGWFHLTRSAEEHGGPHESWFWDPTNQGGGVFLDMGCHSIGVGQYMLTPPNRHPLFLEPLSVSASLQLLKWGKEPFLSQLMKERGVDYSAKGTPAEDYALAVFSFRNPEPGEIVVAQATDSWMFTAPGLKLEMEAHAGLHSFQVNTSNSTSKVFISDAAAVAVANAERAQEKAQASRGLLNVLPMEPLDYGYVGEWVDALAAFREGRNGFLDGRFGHHVVRLLMAGYLSSEFGLVIDLTDPDVIRNLETYIPLIQQGKGAKILLPAA